MRPILATKTTLPATILAAPVAACPPHTTPPQLRNETKIPKLDRYEHAASKTKRKTTPSSHPHIDGKSAKVVPWYMAPLVGATVIEEAKSAQSARRPQSLSAPVAQWQRSRFVIGRLAGSSPPWGSPHCGVTRESTGSPPLPILRLMRTMGKLMPKGRGG